MSEDGQSPEQIEAEAVMDALAGWEDQPSGNGCISDEEAIVWLEDVSGLPYVREIVDSFQPYRQRKPRRRGRMVGYSTLKPDAPREGGLGFGFKRRIFHLTKHDPYEGGGAPTEAVDPRTVKPGVEAMKTSRCRRRSS